MYEHVLKDNLSLKAQVLGPLTIHRTPAKFSSESSYPLDTTMLFGEKTVVARLSRVYVQFYFVITLKPGLMRSFIRF